jgi:hypothetical protein
MLDLRTSILWLNCKVMGVAEMQEDREGVEKADCHQRQTKSQHADLQWIQPTKENAYQRNCLSLR